MKLHDKGFKGQRDRAKCAQKYAEICKYFHVRPLADKDLAILSVERFYRLSEDIFNRQSIKAKRKFADAVYGPSNPEYRINPDSFRWYWYDLKAYTGVRGTAKLWAWIRSPITYRQFLARKAKRGEADNKPVTEKKEE